MGDYDAARILVEDAMTVQRVVGDMDGIASAHYWLAQLALYQGDCGSALNLLLDSVRIFRQTRGYSYIHALGLLGHVARDKEDYKLAFECYRESLHVRVERRDTLAITQSLEDFAGLAWREGHMERAARLLGIAETICKSAGHNVPAGPDSAYQRTVEVSRQALGDEALKTAWTEGRMMGTAQGIDYALDEADHLNIGCETGD